MSAVSFDVVIPTIGRPSLAKLLAALAEGGGPGPQRILLVDDRPDRETPLLADGAAATVPRLPGTLTVLPGAKAGPAAARNTGWRAATATWVAFLDDDVVPTPGWFEQLSADLAAAADDARVAASQGRIRVPLPADRAPTDWERNVAGLETARWATADMAYRRDVLERLGGFDERFPRAYREDADLALRTTTAGYRVVCGDRVCDHPVRRVDRWQSVRAQAGNADSPLMAALHGRGWRAAAGEGTGRLPRHAATTAAALLALIALAMRRPRVAGPAVALWVAGTTELAWARIAPGPKTLDEVVTMLATSVLIPPAATAHWLIGLARRPRLLAQPAHATHPAS